MRKQILLSLVMLIQLTAYGMEKESSGYLSSLNSYLPEWLQSTDKSNFENQLKRGWRAKIYQKAFSITTRLCSTEEINADPTLFLRYCYYQKYHEDEFWDLKELENNPELLKKCQEARIDGYSALGAAMIAKDISGEKQSAFIHRLIILGFRSTPKDATLGIDTLT